jgi:very-short-patch-repair endonuclease
MIDFLREYWQLAAFLAVASAILYFLSRLERNRTLPYEKRNRLLTDAELAFYRVLHSATAGDWPLFAMVRLADLIQVKPQSSSPQAWQNKIHAKHLDFVICDPETLEARLAIELDDKSHQKPDRKARDAFVDAALSAAGLPILRIPCAPQYDRGALRKSIREKLGLGA